MSQLTLDTIRLKNWMKRMHDGDLSAREELLTAARRRLEALARAMLRRFPNVRRWAESDDVYQGASIRLCRCLEKLEINSTKDFYRLATQQMRRELLDLARHFASSKGPQALLQGSFGRPGDEDGEGVALEQVASVGEPSDLDQWAAFHEAVGRLPSDEREAFGLIYYHGWKQADVAELLHVSERTVRRWFEAAAAKIKKALLEGQANP
jgi:RNA polymerase sigma-70 factor (ECF subfamily)